MSSQTVEVFESDTDPNPSVVLAAIACGLCPDDFGPHCRWERFEPRAVMFPGSLRVPKEIRRVTRSRRFVVKHDIALPEILAVCGRPRRPGGGSWLSARLRATYERLADAEMVHCTAVMDENSVLVGGTFGIRLGGLWTAESMFHTKSNAGTLALVSAVEHAFAEGAEILDLQGMFPLLERLGAICVSDAEYRERIALALIPRKTTGTSGQHGGRGQADGEGQGTIDNLDLW